MVILMMAMIMLMHGRASATCHHVHFDHFQPVEFGSYRYQLPFKAAWISLWPDGNFQLSKGLSLSHRSRPQPGGIRVRALPGQRILLAADILIPVHLSYVMELANLRIFARGGVVMPAGENYLLTVHDRDNSVPVHVNLFIGADLLIRQEPKYDEKLSALIQLRCLDSR